MRGLCYFFLSILTQVSSSTLKVIGLFGDNVTLPCSYDARTYSTLSFCWGRGTLPVSKCYNTVLSSEDGAMAYRQSPRYQLLGRMADGDVSLTIMNAQWTDAGVYGCRVEIPGWFNDHKVYIHLVIEEAPTEQPVTEDWILGTQETLVTTAPDNEETGDTRFGSLVDATAEEDSQETNLNTYAVKMFQDKFKAFQRVGNIGRVGAIFLLTVIIILVFIFRRGFLPKRTLQHLNTSAAENIYESV